MKIQQFLDHHGINVNPFSEEDAQTDPVFKDHCIFSTYHPSWGKVYGDPAEPSTSIVFGEKGSGKTALRLQIVRHLTEYNRQHPAQRIFVIEYDDFNPFLDRFVEHMGQRSRRGDQVLAQWKLWDHMDAILSLGVTQLVDRILDSTGQKKSPSVDVGPLEVRKLDRHQARDLLLLAACYDRSTAEAPAPPLASIAPQAALSHMAGKMARGARISRHLGRDRHRGRCGSLDMVRDSLAVRLDRGTMDSLAGAVCALVLAR